MATKKAMFVLLGILVFSPWILGFAIEVKAEEVKAILLKASGWSVYWKGCKGGIADAGESEFRFEVRGEKVVVKIQTPPNFRCERDVTIVSDVVKFDGCLDSGITIRFDPNDREYPFKGKSDYCSEYRLKAK